MRSNCIEIAKREEKEQTSGLQSYNKNNFMQLLPHDQSMNRSFSAAPRRSLEFQIEINLRKQTSYYQYQTTTFHDFFVWK